MQRARARALNTPQDHHAHERGRESSSPRASGRARQACPGVSATAVNRASTIAARYGCIKPADHRSIAANSDTRTRLTAFAGGEDQGPEQQPHAAHNAGCPMRMSSVGIKTKRVAPQSWRLTRGLQRATSATRQTSPAV